jgi:murein L,D-transpeptidase YafK
MNACSAKDVRRRLARAAVAAALGIGIVLSATAAVGSGRPGESPVSPDSLILTRPHVVVLKSGRKLHLFDGERLVRSYPVDLGLDPIGQKVVARDTRTPVGTFRIVSTNAASPYHRFLGLDYPDASAARFGLTAGLISPGEAAGIVQALTAGRRPSWSTDLGGGVGIHGRRRGLDWTGGCIAMDDRQVEELFDVLRIGDRVEILP